MAGHFRRLSGKAAQAFRSYGHDGAEDREEDGALDKRIQAGLEPVHERRPGQQAERRGGEAGIEAAGPGRGENGRQEKRKHNVGVHVPPRHEQGCHRYDHQSYADPVGRR